MNPPRWCGVCNVFESGRVCVEVAALTRVLPDLADDAARVPIRMTLASVRAEVVASLRRTPGQRVGEIAADLGEERAFVLRALTVLRADGAVVGRGPPACRQFFLTSAPIVTPPMTGDTAP